MNASGSTYSVPTASGPLGAVETTSVARSRSGSTASRAAATWAGGASVRPTAAAPASTSARCVRLAWATVDSCELNTRNAAVMHSTVSSSRVPRPRAMSTPVRAHVVCPRVSHRTASRPAAQASARTSRTLAATARRDGASRTRAESSDDCSPTISPHTAAVIRAPSISSRESPGPADRGPVERSSAGTGSRTTGRAISTSSRIAATTASPRETTTQPGGASGGGPESQRARASAAAPKPAATPSAAPAMTTAVHCAASERTSDPKLRPRSRLRPTSGRRWIRATLTSMASTASASTPTCAVVTIIVVDVTCQASSR